MGTFSSSQPPSFSSPRQERSRTKRLVVGATLGLLAAIVLWNCGKGTYHNYRLSSAAVDQFHRQLNQADYEAIYGDATDAFRATGTRADALKVFEVVHQKMGDSGKMSARGFHISWQNGRTTVDQVFETQFTLGRGQESFVWIIEQDQAHLQAYHINSANLN